MNHTYRHLQPTDLPAFAELMQLFSTVFEEPENYAQVDLPHLLRFLQNDSHVVLVVLNDDQRVIGGLVAYELMKFEKNRKELFVYDLAVATSAQRQGVGTLLMQKAKEVAKQRGCYQLFVEAEAQDDGAVAFYRNLQFSEELDARHFTVKF